MTSNVGAREMSPSSIGFGNPESTGIKKALDQAFAPEFRNRLDEIVAFNPLSQSLMENIVTKFIDELSLRLQERNLSISLSAAARKFLAKKGFDPLFGARPLDRFIETNINDPISREILFGSLTKGGSIKVGLRGEELTFKYS